MTSFAFARAQAARSAALALLLAAAGFAGTAYADDEYGTSHEMVIRQAAASPASLRIGIASTVPVASDRSDVVGDGGRQDALARQIYHPGSGTDS